MAAQNSVTVKKADGTTDIVYTAIQPAGGDGTPAVWRQENAGLMVGQRPLFKMKVVPNGSNTARKVHIEHSYPFTYTDSATGLTKVMNVIYGSSDYLIPNECTDAMIAEAIHQKTNLEVAAAIRDAIKAGIAPT